MKTIFENCMDYFVVSLSYYPQILQINKSDKNFIICTDMNNEIINDDPKYISEPDIIIKNKIVKSDSFITKIKNWFSYDLFGNTENEKYEDIAVKVSSFYDTEDSTKYKKFIIPVDNINHVQSQKTLQQMIMEFKDEVNFNDENDIVSINRV